MNRDYSADIYKDTLFARNKIVSTERNVHFVTYTNKSITHTTKVKRIAIYWMNNKSIIIYLPCQPDVRAIVCSIAARANVDLSQGTVLHLTLQKSRNYVLILM